MSTMAGNKRYNIYDMNLTGSALIIGDNLEMTSSRYFGINSTGLPLKVS